MPGSGDRAHHPGRVRAWSEEMRRVHRRLHEALDATREAIETPSEGDRPLSGDLLLHCWGFCLALSGHHRSEDGALFPLLRAGHPDLAVALEELARDHRMIEHLLGGLRAAIDGDATHEERLRHLDGVEAVMTTHFRWEERRLLPALAELTGPGADDAAPRDLLGPLA